jgi:Putative MetA-pathway of phenol degradation
VRRIWFVQKKIGWPGGIEFIAASLAIAVMFPPGLANAQSLEPRAYSNTPVGMNFLVLGYAYQQGDVLLDPSVPVKDASVGIHSSVLAYVRSLDVWGKSGKVDIILPYAWLSGSGKVGGGEQDRKVSGFADPAVRFSVNLYGSPALSLEEFKSYRQDTIIGVSLLVTAPLGQYDSDKLVNIGTNRWSFKPEVGISKALGRWTIETAAGGTFFTKNDDFFGGQTREQDPIYSVQGHLIYNFPRGIWAALNATYYTGGRTRINGVEGDDLQSNWRVGATLAFPVTLQHSVKLYASTGAYTRTGGNYEMIGIAWQYRWGGGL